MPMLSLERGLGEIDVSVCFDRVEPLVDETVRQLGGKGVRDDAIGGGRYARATSIVSSAYKRHGKILEVIFAQIGKDGKLLSSRSVGHAHRVLHKALKRAV